MKYNYSFDSKSFNAGKTRAAKPEKASRRRSPAADNYQMMLQIYLINKENQGKAKQAKLVGTQAARLTKKTSTKVSLFSPVALFFGRIAELFSRQRVTTELVTVPAE